MVKLKLLTVAITLLVLCEMVPGCAVGPRAEFEADVTDGQVPLSVTFTNKSKNASELQWDFGDGSTTTTSITEETVVHDYIKAGTLTVTLTAIKGGEPTETNTATLSITVNPGALDTVTIPPIEVAAGGTKQLEPIAIDKYGNRVSQVDVNWALTNENAGSITRDGLFTSAEVARTFVDAVEVEVAQGELIRTTTASVTITAGEMRQVVIAPNPAEIGMEMTQQFMAVGADQYGNRISGLSFNWSVENGGGTIDDSGLFTAGDTPGNYGDTVRAEATQGDINLSATASVAVEADRIIFISDFNDEQRDIYIMNADGSNVERLTNTPEGESWCSCSPDGRRIIYDYYTAAGGIMAMNDDGSWTIPIINNDSETVHVYPDWSSDGTKIAFIRATPVRGGGIKNTDMFVMDVDGGNVTQLTDTAEDECFPSWSPDSTQIAYCIGKKGQPRRIFSISIDGSNRQRLAGAADNIAPTWSPDGTQIAYASNRDDGEGEIYVMNADGTRDRRLTSTMRGNILPDWSPDGMKIVFASERDSIGRWDMYVMDTDGSNVTRLTHYAAKVMVPFWVPRKVGVEVTEASVIIPNASALGVMTTQEVTAQAAKSVVRVSTDLASGSGVIIDSDGLILTNNHVISSANEIVVYMEDGTSYTGTVDAKDLVRDLAIIKIEATELPPLKLGDVSQLDLGQQVLVLGYPLGSEKIIPTGGLVSAIEYDSGRNITWVQTDSAINPGNSGGPLLNLQGEVVGIVSAKLVGFAIEGIGFAISTNTVNTYLPRLEAGETITAFR
jgi:Tol biopolymer transport system component